MIHTPQEADEPTLLIPRLTRHDLRLQRRSRPVERLVGWLGYGLVVVVVVAAASVLAVRGGNAPPSPQPRSAHPTTQTTVDRGIETISSTATQPTDPSTPTQPVAANPTTTGPSTTPTTTPIAAAAVSPAP